jgi:hypothetical protein
MKCDHCSNNRVFFVSGKSSDLNSYGMGSYSHESYLPHIKGICGGDYFDTKICLDCGKVQGKFPVKTPKFD